ncbi:septal ring lytic transglycosylase RlpA family protein (plasmid) [Sinorhizobium sp. BG8]|nr:septal ring lytic transglycosylase RlpA family protein [Sinorhizobium sp. BG8]
MDRYASRAGNATRCLVIAMVCACCTTCTTAHEPSQPISKGYRSEKTFGVKAGRPASHRKHVQRGSSRYVVGRSYVVKGKRYYPREDPKYDTTGIASWYGSAFHGRLTANGEIYDKEHLSAAHPTLPLPSYVRVTNLENGSSLILRVNDRGPFHKGRLIDVSSKAADMLDLKHRGTASVRVQYVGRARLDGHDMPYLMASYAKKGDIFRLNPELQIGTGVIVALDPSTDVHRKTRSGEKRETLPEIVPFALKRPAAESAWTSRNTEIAWLDDETSSPRPGPFDVRQPGEVRDCRNGDSDGGQTCEIPALPLSGGDRNTFLTDAIFVKRRRARLNGYRWQGTPFFPRNEGQLPSIAWKRVLTGPRMEPSP